MSCVKSLLRHQTETKSLSSEYEVILPADDRFTSAARVWNGLIHRKPSLVVRPRTPEAAAFVVAECVKHGTPFTVRGGGHNVAGFAVQSDAVMVDLSSMKQTRLDAFTGLMFVGGGCLWSDVFATLANTTFTMPAGLISHTGVGGLTLGGGVGWLSRALGLVCDQLVGVTLVTALGEVKRMFDEKYESSSLRNQNCTQHEARDLLWALRGGGGNFGIVTEFVFRLSPVQSQQVPLEVFHFALNLPSSSDSDDSRTRALQSSIRRVAQVLATYTNVATSVDDHIAPYLFLDSSGTGTLFMLVSAFDASRKYSPREPLESLVPQVLTLDPDYHSLSLVSFAELHSSFDLGSPAGKCYYWSRSHFLGADALTRPAFAELLVRTLAQLQTGVQRTIQITPWGGAIRIGAGLASCFPQRRHPFEMHAIGVWEPNRAVSAAAETSVPAWARSFGSAVEEYSADGSGFVNTDNSMEDNQDVTARKRRVYTDASVYRKLQKLKSLYDPLNVFCYNHNVAPALPSADDEEEPIAAVAAAGTLRQRGHPGAPKTASASQDDSQTATLKASASGFPGVALSVTLLLLLLVALSTAIQKYV